MAGRADDATPLAVTRACVCVLWGGPRAGWEWGWGDGDGDERVLGDGERRWERCGAGCVRAGEES